MEEGLENIQVGVLMQLQHGLGDMMTWNQDAIYSLSLSRVEKGKKSSKFKQKREKEGLQGIVGRLLWIFDHIPSYLFLLRPRVMEEGNKEVVSAATRYITGQLMIVIQIYKVSLGWLAWLCLVWVCFIFNPSHVDF